MSGLKIDSLHNIRQIRVPKFLIKLLLPFKILSGVFLIIFGVVGIILPGIPGWTPFIIGVMLLSPKTGKRFAIWAYGIYKKYIVKFITKFKK